jgi:hypothetical protein
MPVVGRIDAGSGAVNAGTIGGTAPLDARVLGYGTSPAATARSDVPGGTLLNFSGSIVPENPGKGQITEAAFLDRVADLMARQLPESPGMGEGREGAVVIMRHLLDRFLVGPLPPGARLEQVLRAAFGLSEDLDVHVAPEKFVNGMIETLPSAQMLRQIAHLAEAVEGLRTESSEEGLEAAAEALFRAAGVFWFPPGAAAGTAKKVSFIRFTQLVGNHVHALIQAHYWAAHPQDVLMFEDFLVAGPALLAEIYGAGTWAAPYDFMPALRAALVSAKATPSNGKTEGPSKRPDIFNVSLKHLYEIKPAGNLKRGVAQLAEYQRRLKPFFPDLHLAGRAPGDWRPFAMYFVGGNVFVTTDVPLPGLIVYTRYGTPQHVLLPLIYWANERKKAGGGQAARYPVGVPQATAGPVPVPLVAVALVAVLFVAAAVVVAPAAAGVTAAMLGRAAIGGGLILTQ